jgi:inner membrane transporter RhtA
MNAARPVASPPAPAANAPTLLGRVPPPLLLLCSITSVQVGAAVAVHLFGFVGPGGAVLLRVGGGALILVAARRGLPLRASRQAYGVAILFGLTLACMNFVFYLALARIPLGIAVTIEFVGPLGVAVAGSRRVIDFVWVAMAAAGIILFAPWTGARLDPVGIVLALAAGGCWAAYIILSARMGRHFSDNGGLALALCVGALLLLPVGLQSAGSALLNPLVLLAGGVVALFSSALPYALEIEALRRLPTHVFGIMMSAEPAVAALAGLVLLGERLSGRDILALVLVTGATLGVEGLRQREKGAA